MSRFGCSRCPSRAPCPRAPPTTATTDDRPAEAVVCHSPRGDRPGSDPATVELSCCRKPSVPGTSGVSGTSAFPGGPFLGERLHGAFPDWPQFELAEPAAAYGHGAHRHRSALAMTRGEGHSGPWSAVGDGRAHVVLLVSWSYGGPPTAGARMRCRTKRACSLGCPPGVDGSTVEDEQPARLLRALVRTEDYPPPQNRHTCDRMARSGHEPQGAGVGSRVAAGDVWSRNRATREEAPVRLGLGDDLGLAGR